MRRLGRLGSWAGFRGPSAWEPIRAGAPDRKEGRNPCRTPCNGNRSRTHRTGSAGSRPHLPTLRQPRPQRPIAPPQRMPALLVRARRLALHAVENHAPLRLAARGTGEVEDLEGAHPVTVARRRLASIRQAAQALVLTPCLSMKRLLAPHTGRSSAETRCVSFPSAMTQTSRRNLGPHISAIGAA